MKNRVKKSSATLPSGKKQPSASSEAWRVDNADAELTIQEVADFLNVSKSFVVALIEFGELRCQRAGRRRRIIFQDLMDYRRRTLTSSKTLLDKMAIDDQRSSRTD